MYQGFAQALQMELVYIRELFDQAFEHADVHDSRRLTRRTFRTQRHWAHATTQIAGRPVRSARSAAVPRQAAWLVLFDAQRR
jgi:hypothetical protein